MVEGRSYRIRIEPSEHVFICGHTQYGKSYLASALIGSVKVHRCIIDIKHAVDVEGSVIVHAARDITKAFEKHQTVTYRPVMDEGKVNWDDVDRAFHDCYQRGNTTIYNDERGGWPRLLQREMLPWEAFVTMRGAFRNATIWTITQRPKLIPVHLKTEASHFFVFHLLSGNDRRDISEYVGNDLRNTVIPKRWFFYRGPGMPKPVLLPPLGKTTVKPRRTRKAG
jgi:hypothetical protein